MTATISGTTGGIGLIGSGTAQNTTSGTAIDFTGIPAGTKQIVFMLNQVSTSSNYQKVISIGTSSGFEVTNYFSASTRITTTTIDSTTDATPGYLINSVSGGDSLSGAVILTLENSTTNSWALSGSVSDYAQSRMIFASGIKSLAGVLDRIQITTVSGVDTFDAGEVNIAYI